MNINPHEPPPFFLVLAAPSQPASLAAHLRAPVSQPALKDLMSQYQSINLAIPSNTYAWRQTPAMVGCPLVGAALPTRVL